MNLFHKTIGGFPQNLTAKRVLHCGGMINNNFYIFGGDQKCTSDMIITSEEKVEAIDVDFNEIVHPNRMNIKHFTTARKSL
jgi:hypothetical protein